MTILIVDDRDENLYFLQVLLKAHNFEVETAVNGEDALKKARNNPPRMIISDILMPKMDGFALCRHWKQDNVLRSIPFIVYTATYTDPKDKEFALSLGADRFIVKPAEPDDFMKTIHEVLEQQQLDSSESAIGEQTHEEQYLRQHNEALVRKLEKKINALQESNRRLEQEITERKATEARLLTSIKSNKKLLQELYHRTNNNMQVISSLLILDAKKHDNEQVHSLVQSANNRIQAMSLVHQMLFRSKDLSRLDLKDYVETLADLLTQRYQRVDQKISLKVTIESISSLIDTAIPLGLVLHELISSSMKYSFADTNHGEIRIDMKSTGNNEIYLTYADNGAGLGEKEKTHKTDLLGFNVIRGIVENQLQGWLSIQDKDGVEVDIRISNTLYTERV